MQLLEQKYGNGCLQSCKSPVLNEYIVVIKQIHQIIKFKWNITSENKLESSEFCHVLLIN
jgi:hypothetical protein